MLRSIVFSTLFAFSPILILGADEKTDNSKSCSISIDQPKQGEAVGPDGPAYGSATLPPGTYAWILARKQSISGYWPQANGPSK